MSLQPGNQVGDYQILRELGAGGMGKVYQVRNVISDRIEAMKVLLPDLEREKNLADRFLREIKVQAALDHPNIAGLRTAMREGNQLLMIMEFVDGHTIDEYMANGPIPVQNAVEACMKVCEALEYAHQRGIVHRDIKPSNIMVTNAGVVKLMDFGIARVMSDPSLTQTSQTTGSLYYMSPEQINGAALDGRSDLYSLGVSLYQMITGQRPFDGTNTFSIMAAHLNQPPVPPVQHDPRIPAPVSDVILRALAKDPGARFQSAMEFHAALAQSLHAPLPILKQQPAPLPAKSGHRGIYMAIGSLATVAVLVVLAMQAPKFLKTKAQEQPPEQKQEQKVELQQQQQPAVEQPPASDTPKPQAPAPQTAKRAASSAAGGPAVAVDVPAQQQQPAIPAPPVAQQQQQQQQPPPSRAPEVDTAAIRQLKTRIVQMAQRIASAKTAYNSLRESMSRQGLQPRAELASAQQRAGFEMDQAEAALTSGDLAGARQHLDYAERALEQLERALNL